MFITIFEIRKLDLDYNPQIQETDITERERERRRLEKDKRDINVKVAEN